MKFDEAKANECCRRDQRSLAIFGAFPDFARTRLPWRFPGLGIASCCRAAKSERAARAGGRIRPTVAVCPANVAYSGAAIGGAIGDDVRPQLACHDAANAIRFRVLVEASDRVNEWIDAGQ